MKLSNSTAKLTSIAQSIPTTLNTTMLRAVAAATLAAAALAMAPAAHAQRLSVGVTFGQRYVAPAPVYYNAYNNGYYVGPEPYAPPIIVRGHDDFRYDHDRYDRDRDRRDYDRDRHDRDHDFHR